MVRGQLHGMHSGGGSVATLNVKITLNVKKI